MLYCIALLFAVLISFVVLEDMVLVSRRLKDLESLDLGLGIVTKVLGLGLDRRVLVLVLRQKSYDF